jgi:hypothetical protein
MVKIKLNNNEYEIPDSVFAAAKADFVAHLGTIAGSGLKVVVGGVEYSVDATKVAGAVAELEGVLAGLDNSAPQLNEYGFYYNLPYSGYIDYFSTTAYLFVHEDGTSTVYLGGTTERGTHTIDGKTLTYASASMGELHLVFSEDGTSAQIMELGATIALGDNSIMIDSDYVYTYVEDLGGYEVKCIDKTKAEYGAIKTGINGIDTVKLAEAMFNGNTNLAIAPKIPDSVTIIDTIAFQGCSSLTSINIPDSVKNIGRSAFNNCDSLTSILLPIGITNISEYMLAQCDSLISIVIPNSVTTISSFAFFNCPSLGRVEIPNSVTEIGLDAFANCEMLASITFKGTTAQWNTIALGQDWNGGVPATYVQCTDGQVAL